MVITNLYFSLILFYPPIRPINNITWFKNRESILFFSLRDTFDSYKNSSTGTVCCSFLKQKNKRKLANTFDYIIKLSKHLRTTTSLFSHSNTLLFLVLNYGKLTVLVKHIGVLSVHERTFLMYSSNFYLFFIGVLFK